MKWMVILRLPRMGIPGDPRGKETLAFCSTNGEYKLSTGKNDLTMPVVAIEHGVALTFDTKELAEAKAVELRADGVNGHPWPLTWEITVIPTADSFYNFTSPDPRARRIDSTESFKTTITWTREQLHKIADQECPICLGTGVLEAVEPKACDCCWRER